MKNIFRTHIAFITVILMAGGVVWHKYNSMAGSQNFSGVLARANAIIEKHNVESFELVKQYHEKFNHPETAKNYSNSLFISAMRDSILQNVRSENMVTAARLYNVLTDSIQRFVSNPIFDSMLDGLKNENGSDAVTLQTKCALLTYYSLMQMQWYPGSDMIDCRGSRTVLIGDVLNPSVGDTVNYDVVLSFEKKPHQYMEFTLNDQSLTIKNDTAQTTLEFHKPGVYPLKIAGSVTMVDSDSIARFNKTFYVKIKP